MVNYEAGCGLLSLSAAVAVPQFAPGTAVDQVTAAVEWEVGAGTAAAPAGIISLTIDDDLSTLHQ